MTISLRVQQQLMESASSSSGSFPFHQPQQSTHQPQLLCAHRPSIGFSSSNAWATSHAKTIKTTVTTSTSSPLGHRVWTCDEHARFLQALAMFPSGPWKNIAQHVGTRTPRQAMTHAQKFRLKASTTQFQLSTPMTSRRPQPRSRRNRTNSIPGSREVSKSPINWKGWRVSSELFVPRGINVATSPTTTSSSSANTNTIHCKAVRKSDDAVLYDEEVDLQLLDTTFHKTACHNWSPVAAAGSSDASSSGHVEIATMQQMDDELEDADMDSINEVLDSIVAIHAMHQFCSNSETPLASLPSPRMSTWSSASQPRPLPLSMAGGSFNPPMTRCHLGSK